MINLPYADRPMEALPDESSLVRQAKSGNTDAFIQLYEAYVDCVYKYVYFRATDDRIAERLTPRIFIQAWQLIDRYRTHDLSFLAWLYKLASDQLIDYFHTHSIQKTVDRNIESVGSITGSAFGERIGDKLDLQGMRHALQLLTTDEQHVLALKFIAGVPDKIIARMTSRSVKAVRDLLTDALQTVARIDERWANTKSFHLILEECLTALSNDTFTVDECLVLYPRYAGRLEPLLKTARGLKFWRDVKPSHAFNVHSRFYLTQQLRFYTLQSKGLQISWRIALSLAMLISALFVTGTVHAQSVLPGDSFYSWKRASEEVWRALSINPVDVDLALSERRLNEWVAVADDPELSTDAMQGYFNELSRLKRMNDVVDNHKVILPAIRTHQVIMSDAGLPGAELVNDYLVVQITPSLIPTVTSIPASKTPVFRPTITLQPTFTFTLAPTNTATEPWPTATNTVVPTVTPTNVPTFTVTSTEMPTATATAPEPTATATAPAPTATAPEPTSTPIVPEPTTTLVVPPSSPLPPVPPVVIIP